MVLPALKAVSKHPRHTRSALVSLKQAGDVRGWFGLVKKGRPESNKRINLIDPIQLFDPNDGATAAGAAPPGGGSIPPPNTAITAAAVTPARRPAVRTNWATNGCFDQLKAAVVAVDVRVQHQASFAASATPLSTEADLILQECFLHSIPRSTLTRQLGKFREAVVEFGIPLDELTVDHLFRPWRRLPLFVHREVKFLSDTISYRDLGNRGMTRGEVISLMMEMKQLGGTVNRVKCESHFDYLIRNLKLPQLKRGGRVVSAQATTTKRSQIMVSQQLRWHTTVDSALAELRRLNQPSEDFDLVADDFFGNLDETCYMANAHGCVKVIGSKLKKKTERISDDCRDSITSVRTGMASGTPGPFIFLAKGIKNPLKHLRGDLSPSNPGLPANSRVIMTPNAYMNNEVYAAFVKDYCQGIRAMPVIRDHPNWWVCISMDGFGSHVNVHSALETFAKYKILIIKEEGDTSQVNQAYDQSVGAKRDKKDLADCLQLVSRTVKMDQWYLIKLAIQAQLKVSPEDWVASHKNVNMHPLHQVDFNAWIRKLDERGFLLSGEKFFEHRRSLYDAMPACWIRLRNLLIKRE